MSKKINMVLLSDFASFPGFRYATQTKGSSGEEFRNNVLIPALEKHEKIIVDLDTGVKKAILPSFLEEAFAGLSRIRQWDLDDFRKHIEIKTEDKEYLSDIKHYVEVCNH